MKMTFKLFAASIAILFVACNGDDDPVINTIATVSVANLPADPPTGYDPTNGAPIGQTNKFSFFRFSDSTIVAHSDSATTKWDIGFRGSEVILNSGISGPGNAAAFVFNGLLSELKVVPTDSTFKQDATGNYAIGKTWYNYDPVAMVLTPKPGKIFVIRTSDNKFVKMEVLSYYKNSPTSPNAFTDAARYYSFRYVYQGNGTTKFE